MTDILKKCLNYSIPLVICVSLLKAQGGYSLSLNHHRPAAAAQAGVEVFPVPAAASGLYEFGGNKEGGGSGSNSNPSRGGASQWRPNVQYFMKLFRKSPSLKVILPLY